MWVSALLTQGESSASEIAAKTTKNPIVMTETTPSNRRAGVSKNAAGSASEQGRRAVSALEKAIEAVAELAAEREQMKLSNSRVVGVGKELKDLRKVLVLAVH